MRSENNGSDVSYSAADTQADGQGQYLTFILAGEEYGVDILRVQEIKGWDTVTPIPNTPSYIKGVINLRGTIVPIVDLRTRFGMVSIEYGPTTVVIVLRTTTVTGSTILGIVVDGVSEVYNIRQEEIKEPPQMGKEADIRFVYGLATIEEKMIILMDVDQVLNEKEMAVVEKLVA